eukprot:TRINITY_DN4224_c0_g3_i1.p1 TRINITY_DN4224_c0_g3~~TRINITY_DN4224_c0_g3_i1.p1  ORF type:complete len:214 (+),score=17.82 TRINITY_DN4224_c0_g3_i1:23-664(+)
MAFTYDDVSQGGCPDVTNGNVVMCNSSEAIHNRPQPSHSLGEFVREQASDCRSVDMKAMNTSVSPLLSINYQTNSICEINVKQGVCEDLIAITGVDLSDYQRDPLTTTYNDTAFFLFRGQLKHCDANLIIGYRYATNEIVYNFTSTAYFDWLAADESSLVGLSTAANPTITTTYGGEIGLGDSKSNHDSLWHLQQHRSSFHGRLRLLQRHPCV